jgi:chromosome partitioning protein
MSIYAIANPTAAAGKTTTAIGLASYLGSFGARTLLIDCDPQGDATAAVVRVHTTTLDHVLSRRASLAASAAPSALPVVDLVASAPGLAGAETRFRPSPWPGEGLDVAFQAAARRYAYTVVDCPPALSLLTATALSVARTVIVPVPAEPESLGDVAAFLETLREVRSRSNPGLRVALLLTMNDGSPEARQVVDEIRATYPALTFRTVVPHDPQLTGVLERRPILDLGSPGSRAYRELALELASRAALAA